MSADRRIYVDKQSPSVYKAMLAAAAELHQRTADVGLERSTLELVNVRVSQINRCAFCLDRHSRLAERAGVTPQRLAVLAAWREVDLFTDEERAALEIAEAVTLVADRHVSDEEYARFREHLSDDAVSLLIWAATTINAFNRVSIMSRHRVAERDPAEA
ncbi:carboxymuconolactone decarboxylase family protein [Saccharopolyspora oryzae]|uniref:Carboxymuconolactone decarboxylase family protein n=1 Tax=Saccharopolyspora oryzae TaxID=2997343 RepID=A0ABT4VBC3_9PSEU|nr:carboxymuconolactone decarboxylase family protein [Saccharopolyspora oryzae]MDA3631272.1 carboxymuconolactone decarboxylase family protein [Saccharopolyspora oryzae]